MSARDTIFYPVSFDEERLSCPHCGWSGNGSEANIAGFYGLSRYKEVLCPTCSEYLGNLAREDETGRSQERWDSQKGPLL